MKKCRVAEIYCGLPGSGKSTLARKGGAHVIETDDYFLTPQSGKYVFVPEHIGEAHAWNLRRWISMCSRYEDHIAVANTNTTIEEIAPYFSVAKAFGYNVFVHLVKCSVETSVARNTHGVPEATIQKMHLRLKDLRLPPYWTVTEVVTD